MGEDSQKTNIEGGGGLGQFTDLRGGGGGLGRKEGNGVFEEGWYPNAHYANMKDSFPCKQSIVRCILA